jgi:peroxiredoxin
MIAVRAIALLLTLTVIGCNSSAPPAPASAPVMQDYGVTDDAIQFLDNLATNTTTDDDISNLVFTNPEGQQVPLKSHLGQKSLVLVITRGYAGSICPYCATQTSRLIANYGKIQERNAEVIVVYPLEKPSDQPNLDQFVARAVSQLPTDSRKVPFPLLLDVALKSVDKLGLRRNLSKPATYIFDREGRVQFAYVGNSLADRPSIKAILEQLDKINQP